MIKTTEKINDKRNFNRQILDTETCIMPVGQSERVNCLTCNISEGGIKIVTDKKLLSEKFNIIMVNQKFPVRIIYMEFMEDKKYVYGMKFTKPISLKLKEEIILNLNKKTSFKNPNNFSITLKPENIDENNN
jgi:hypothetical protein